MPKAKKRSEKAAKKKLTKLAKKKSTKLAKKKLTKAAKKGSTKLAKKKAKIATRKKASTSGRSSPAKTATGKSSASKSKVKLPKFKVGDYLVYPMHGVGHITSISRESILGKKKNCYVMEIQNTMMKVMVPVESARQVGIRPIISKREVPKVMNLLRRDEVDTEEDWKIRYQNNLTKIKSGSIYEVAEVCRNLYKRARDRELSLMERRLYESAYKLISNEIALTKDVSVEEAGNIISEILA